MRAQLCKVIPAMLALFTLNASGTTRYVDVSNPSPASPYTNWFTAATKIQTAVDASVAGDRILVTNGIYSTGGRADLVLTNRVLVDKALVVQSVNGPTVTVIEGYQVPGTINGDNAIRCVSLAANATLAGFTLTKGATTARAGTDQGGGVRCASSAVVSNCVLTGNSAGIGGGASGGTLKNCLLTYNSASYGGGAYDAILKNCTCVGNSASMAGGGIATSGLSILVTANSVIAGNTAPSNSNYFVDSGFGGYFDFEYCCTTPLSASGVGNITNVPLLVDEGGGDLRLQSTSPCINAGKNAFAPSGSDLDGKPRVVGGTVDMGAYEFQSPTSLLSYAWAQQKGFPTDGSADFADPDGDGASNWHEWQADTIPTNALSVLRIVSVTNGPSGLNVTWKSVSTRSYFLERATSFGNASSFQSIATNIAGASGSKTYTNISATNGGSYFYRVGVQ